MNVLSLPDECLLFVYNALEDFDEAYNLSQSSRRFREVFRASYLRILRSIVARSEIYLYDIRLCHFIDEVQAYSLQYDLGFEPPTHCRPSGPKFIDCYFATPKKLTETHVLSIVGRWHRTRRLQNLYLRSFLPQRPPEAAMQRKTTHVVPLEEGRELDTTRFSLHSDELLHIPRKSFDSVQTKRFYKALMAYWLAMEAHHLARISNYEGAKEEVAVYGLLERLWIGATGRTLMEAMDILEVQDFVYGFLLGEILSHDGFSRCWISAGMRRFGWGWKYFVDLCRIHIRPFQVADLVPDPRRTAAELWPHNKVECAGACGMFDRRGTLLDGSASEVLSYRFSVQDLESDAELKILGLTPREHANDYANIWSCFRRHWNEQASSVFWWAESSGDVLCRIDDYARKSACLRVHPDFVHLSRRLERLQH